jgi:AraC-like DNA-binding protein
MLSARSESLRIAEPAIVPPTLVDVRSFRAPNDEAETPAISLFMLRGLLLAARDRGIAPDVPELAGVDLAALSDPSCALPRECAGCVMERLADANNDPYALLELGRNITEGHYHFAGPLLANQLSARKAIDLFLALRRTLLGGPSWRLSVADGVVRVGHPRWNEGRTGRLEAEFGLSVAFHAALRFWGPWAAPSISLEFAFPRPLGGPDHERFFGARVRYGAPLNALVFPEPLLDFQRPTADPELAARLSAYARDKYLQEPGSSSWAQRVETALRKAKGPAGLELHSVARQCRVSARTLRRRLLEEDVTFSDIRARVRVELAANMLVATDQPVSAISVALGYADANSFRRAFRRWASRTPAQYRVCRGLDELTPA